MITKQKQTTSTLYVQNNTNLLEVTWTASSFQHVVVCLYFHRIAAPFGHEKRSVIVRKISVGGYVGAHRPLGDRVETCLSGIRTLFAGKNL